MAYEMTIKLIDQEYAALAAEAASDAIPRQNVC